jgi:peptidoglycan/LPS O-acetylase OafA/YrhL
MGLPHGQAATGNVASSSKKATRRFLTLDALRGVGAIAVMAGHAGILLNAYMPPFMYLSVDMFFVLSGFVLAHAYDGKFAEGLSVWAFLKARIARLYPIYLIGLVLGLAGAAVSNTHALTRARALLSFFFGLFALPSPPVETLGALFPLNGPFWSLFFEFWVANLAFALFWRKMHGRLLLAVILGSASILAFLGLRFGGLDFGWTWHQFPGGLVRVCYSFFAGVALLRLHARQRHSFAVPSWLCLFIFAAIVLLPLQGPMKALYEVFIVLLVFPILIYFGAGAVERRPQIGKVLGDASYAIYAVHRPLLAILLWPLGMMGVLENHPSPARHYLIEAALVSVIGVMAWFINRWIVSRKAA